MSNVFTCIFSRIVTVELFHSQASPITICVEICTEAKFLSAIGAQR